MNRTIVSVTHFLRESRRLKGGLSFFIFCFLFGAEVFLAHAYDEKKASLEELKKTVFNFDEVSPGIYRSGLIFKEDASLLSQLGIKTVISFHDDKTLAERERKFLGSYGIRMIWLPWEGVEKPKDETIEKSLKLMDTTELRPILIHCKRGADRTGVTVAAYRVTKEGWPAARAYEEMKAHKFRSFRYGHLKEYLYDLAYKRGDSEARIDSTLERAKTNTLSSIYRLRKLSPFYGPVKQDASSEN